MSGRHAQPLRSGAMAVDDLLVRFPVAQPPPSTAGAAVTIVLRKGPYDVEVLLIERATNPADPASGDVALPGGRVEGQDDSLASTALRELREEVGLAPTDLGGPLRFVGAMPARRFGMNVGVFAGAIAPSASAPTIGSPNEVAHLFWLPGRSLADARLVARDLDGRARQVLASVHDGRVVWGFTRRVLREFFGLPAEGPSDGTAVGLRPTEGTPAPRVD